MKNKLKINRIVLFAVLVLSFVLLVNCEPVFLSGKKGVVLSSRAADELMTGQELFLQNWEGSQLPINHKQEWLDMTDSSKTWFYVNDPIQASEVSDQEIEIKSYALYAVKNVEVWLKLAGYPNKVHVFTIPEVIPLSVTRYTLPICLESGVYPSSNGVKVQVPKIDSLGGMIDSLSVDSKDSWYRKIRDIKTNWRVTFGRYGVTESNMTAGSHPSWTGMTPIYAREWIAAITNWAWVLSSQTVATVFNPSIYEEMFGAAFHPGAGKNFTTQQQYDDYLYNNLLYYNGTVKGKTYSNNAKNVNLGLLRGGTGVLGLGGGATFGIYCGCFYELYYGAGYANVIVHEFGHCVGQGHDGSMPYGEFESGCTQIWATFSRLGMLPYNDDSVNGINDERNDPQKVPYLRDYFWNAKSGSAYPNEEIKGWGYGQNNKKPRKKLNSVELYFLEHESLFSEVVPKLRDYILWHPDDFSSAEYRWRTGGSRNAVVSGDDAVGENPLLDDVSGEIEEQKITYYCSYETEVFDYFN